MKMIIPMRIPIIFSWIICLSPSDTPEECGLTDVDGKNEEPYYLHNNVRSKNIDRPIIAHLNINSYIRNSNL